MKLFSMHRAVPLLAVIAGLLFTATAARAGTFSTAAWTGDSTSGLSSSNTLWAYHFGANTTATVNGVTVPGLAHTAGFNPITQAGQFTLSGPNFIIPSDTNDLTALGGTGSAVIAGSFIAGADPTATLTIQGLTAGLGYTVTMLSCGWNVVNEPHAHTFASGGDSIVADFNSGGLNKGFRVDYTFTADAATRTITLTKNPANFTWHFYGLALRNGIASSGIHQNLGGRWRTASVAKPQDIDADNVLGTDGYHVVNRPAVLPAYVGSTTILGSVFPGNGGYTQLDDPLAMPGTFQSGTITAAPGFGAAANLFQFTLNAQAAGRVIRVGLLVDNLDAEAFNPDSLQLVQTAPDSVSSAVVATTSAAFNNRVADWVFFDIAAGASGGTFAVRGVAGSNNEATVAGVAFDSATPLVTTTNNAGPGSLRQAVAYAALNPGADTITFTPALSGGTITLSSEVVVNDATGAVTIDASNLSGGVTLTRGGAGRIFTVNSGSTVGLTNLTLTGSSGTGALSNSGTLTLTRCTVTGNTGGGALTNASGATLSLTQCTLSGNTASNAGGALVNSGTLTLTHCTVTGNTAGNVGGGIYTHSLKFSTLTIVQSITGAIDQAV